MRTDLLSDKAYDLLKQTLLNTGQGVFISARQFASNHNMSYTPVREAFLRLNKEGLLDLVPNVGFFTPQINAKDIVEIFQVRECLELFVLRKVFHLITKEHINKLVALCESQYSKLESDDVQGYMKADEAFHMVFIALYDNQHILNVYKNIREENFLCSKNIANRQSNEAIDEHQILINSIADSDIEGAVSALAIHIEKAKQRLREGFIRVLS